MDKRETTSLDDIQIRIDEDLDRIGENPTIADRIDHLAVYGIHKAIIATRNSVVRPVTSRTTAIIKPAINATSGLLKNIGKKW